MTYQVRNCDFCKIGFQPSNSRQKCCSSVCRFKQIALKFESHYGCWEWPLSKHKVSGYGQFMVSSNPMTLELAHRYSFEVFLGTIPNGLFVCHRCDNRACFNPSHLFLGTAADNTRDMISKGRQQDYLNVVRGSGHPLVIDPSKAFRKLSEETALAIMHAVGSEREIARRFSTSRGNVRSIRNGSTWKSLGSARKDTALAAAAAK